MRNDKMAVGNRRLLKLAAFLMTVPKKAWNYASWATAEKDENGDKKRESVVLPVVPTECNTSACALGWATAIPSLRKLGLVLKFDSDNNSNYVVLRGVTGDEVQEENTASCMGRYNDLPNSGSIVAAMKVFHLDSETARALFLLGRYGDTRAAIADGIRRIVASPERGNGRT